MNITTSRRVIAKAKHEDPATGKRCRGAVSTMVEPTRGFTVAVAGQPLPVWDRHAGMGFTNRENEVDVETFEGWAYDAALGEAVHFGCPACGERKVLRGSLVKGKTNPTKTCTPRCEGATGFDCECACGGDNHGAAHG